MEYWEGTSYHFALAHRLTRVVRALIAIHIAVFAAQIVCYFIPAWRSVPEQVLGLSVEGIRRGHLWQFVTYMFLHAPNWILHIIFNMLCLYWFGCDIEAQFGSRRFLIFYLTAGVAAGLLSWGVLSAAGGGGIVVGASGAIMAILVVCAIYFPHRRVIYILFPMKLRTLVLLVLGLNLWSTFVANGNEVAALAHLGGAAYGYLFVRATPMVAKRLRRLQEARERRAWQRAQGDRERLDQILDKVHREGMGALKWREKRFLQYMSRQRGR